MKLFKSAKRVAVKHDPWKFDPRYPNAWRGESGVYALFGQTGLRIRWFYAKRQNDWMHVDTATRINVSPSFAKWFHFSSYYAGMRRNMYHLTIGHFNVSLIPGQSSIRLFAL
jgi:hypothetical protein